MTSYYDGPDLESTIIAALRGAGLDPEAIDSDDLAALDEFHALGRAGTAALAELAAIQPGTRVIDVGAGIGGPARALARHHGAVVTAVEPTERFARVARMLTARTGLEQSVEVICADGRSLPFGDGSFELAWTQAVWQSVDHKATLAGEIRRVLCPGGRLAMFELIGDGSDLHFPVPWGDGPRDSFVPTETALRGLLEDAGFTVEHWLAGPAAQGAVVAAASDPQRMKAGVPGVGLELLMPDYAERMAGLARNVEAGKIGLLLAVLTN